MYDIFPLRVQRHFTKKQATTRVLSRHNTRQRSRVELCRSASSPVTFVERSGNRESLNEYIIVIKKRLSVEVGCIANKTWPRTCIHAREQFVNHVTVSAKTEAQIGNCMDRKVPVVPWLLPWSKRGVDTVLPGMNLKYSIRNATPWWRSTEPCGTPRPNYSSRELLMSACIVCNTDGSRLRKCLKASQ